MEKELKWKTEKVNAKELKVDATYQREATTSRVKKIAKEWNTAYFNAPIVSRRENGELYCLDGNHTRLASILVYGDASRITCRVFEGLTKSEEAKIFYQYNSAPKKLSFNEKFKALVAGGDVLANEYIKMLDRTGLKYSLSNTGAGKGVICHSALYEAFKYYSKSLVESALTTANAIWGNDIKFLRADVLTGIIKFYDTYNGYFNEGTFKKSVAKVSLSELERHAGTYKTSISYKGSYDGVYMAMAFVDIYNKGKRTNRLELTNIKMRKEA